MSRPRRRHGVCDSREPWRVGTPRPSSVRMPRRTARADTRQSRTRGGRQHAEPRSAPSTPSRSASRSSTARACSAASPTRDRRGGRHDRRRRPDRGRRPATPCATSPSTPPGPSTGSGSSRRSRRSTAPRSSTPPTARSCCTSAARSSSATSRRCKTRDDLSMAYTPGVARVCMAIHEDPRRRPSSTRSSATRSPSSPTASAVLGLGDIGPEAAMPVMEGKAMLFKEFARRRRVPDLPRHQGPRRDRRRSSSAIAPDASAASTSRTSPRRAASRSRTASRPALDIPVFHDDQHGTAVVVLAALLNACKLTGPQPGGRARARRRPRRRRRRGHEDPAATPASRDIIGCDSRGAAAHEPRGLPRRLDAGRSSAGSPSTRTPSAAAARPPTSSTGTDLFIGLSGARVHAGRGARAHERRTRWSSRWPTRTPRSRPRRPRRTRAIIATGRSDYPNQINNVLCFPGIFRGALDVRARDDHRGDEDGRRARDRRDRRRRRAARGLHHPVGLQPRRRPAVADAVADEARAQGAATAEAGAIGFARGDTSEFRAVG